MNPIALLATTLRALILSPPKCKKINCKYRKLKREKVMTSFLYFIFEKNIPGDGGDGNYIRWEIKGLFYFCNTCVQSFSLGWNHTFGKPRCLIVDFNYTRYFDYLVWWFTRNKGGACFQTTKYLVVLPTRTKKKKRSAKWCKLRVKAQRYIYHVLFLPSNF